jgi:hypothetical protein
MNIQEPVPQSAGEEPEITLRQFLSLLITQKKGLMAKDLCTLVKINTITHPLQSTPTQLQGLYILAQPETPNPMGMVE